MTMYKRNKWSYYYNLLIILHAMIMNNMITTQRFLKTTIILYQKHKFCS